MLSQADWTSFHDRHFSSTSVNHFTEHFLGPAEDTVESKEEDDELGYYPDGVKRTLTDEQIAIFRHSEIEAILRARRHAEEMKDGDDGALPTPQSLDEGAPTEDKEEGEMEDGEVENNAPAPKKGQKKRGKLSEKRQQKAQHARDKGWYKKNIKPDLRKRTWDMVEDGGGDLQYDEEEGGSASVAPSAPQRRRISYDD